jgi:hypothetical protein
MGTAKELGDLGLHRELDDQLRAETGNIFKHHGKITIGVEQGVDLATDTVNGRYSLRHGRRSPSSACRLRRNLRPSSFTPKPGTRPPGVGVNSSTTGAVAAQQQLAAITM